MNPKSLLFIVLLILFGFSAAKAQDDKSKQIIIEAKKVLAKGATYADGSFLSQAKAMLKPLTTHENLSPLAHYYLAYADYQMAVAVERMDKDRAVAYLDSAVEYLEAAVVRDERFAEAYALLGSCYGMKIGFAPLKGIILGPKSSSVMSKAKALAPENPRVALLDAIGTYNTPALFGGGKEKGLAMMKKAAELFDRWKETDPLQPSWGKEEAFAWIGIAHLHRKELILAKRAFEKALEINPEYQWVKQVLMPRVATEAGAKE